MTGASQLLMHATCVALGDKAVLLQGPSGSGKSDLALRLICTPPPSILSGNLKALLVSDDQTLLFIEEGRLMARPPQAIAGKIELRGIGIFDMAFLPQAEVKLIARLVHLDEVPRLPPSPLPGDTILGVNLPVLALAPFELSAPLKLWLALHRMS